MATGLGLTAVALAFLAGAVPFPYIIARLWGGIDIREHGSRNPGASNVYRVLGFGPGALTFVLDCSKAIAAVKFATLLGLDAYFMPDTLIWIEIGLGVLSVLGHVFSPFLGGRGGKGVATVIGVFWVLFPLGLLTAALCGAAVILVFRYFSLGSLVGVCILPIAHLILNDQPFLSAVVPVLYLSLAVALLVLVRHSDNIRRLISGKEHGMSAADAADPGSGAIR